MSSREKILASVLASQPRRALNEITVPSPSGNAGAVEEFVATLVRIGGAAVHIASADDIQRLIREKAAPGQRIVSPIFGGNIAFESADPHDFSDVGVCLLEGKLGVAENGAVWLTDSEMHNRVLPFICDHLFLLLREDRIVADLAQAYQHLGPYEYGTFIAGPSKTADIEQALVLGAHGPATLTVLLHKPESIPNPGV